MDLSGAEVWGSILFFAVPRVEFVPVDPIRILIALKVNVDIFIDVASAVCEIVAVV